MMYNFSDEMLWDVAADLLDEQKGLHLTERQVLRAFGSHCFIDDDYIEVWIDNLSKEDKATILYHIKLTFQDYVLQQLHHVWGNIMDGVS